MMKAKEEEVLRYIGKRVIVTLHNGVSIEGNVNGWYTGDLKDTAMILMGNTSSGCGAIGSTAVSSIELKNSIKADMLKSDDKVTETLMNIFKKKIRGHYGKKTG